jgi:hypothetical protein
MKFGGRGTEQNVTIGRKRESIMCQHAELRWFAPLSANLARNLPQLHASLERLESFAWSRAYGFANRNGMHAKRLLMILRTTSSLWPLETLFKGTLRRKLLLRGNDLEYGRSRKPRNLTLNFDPECVLEAGELDQGLLGSCPYF